jgi:hypothetical protein
VSSTRHGFPYQVLKVSSLVGAASSAIIAQHKMHTVAGQVVSTIIAFEGIEFKDPKIKVRFGEVLNDNSAS